MSCMKINYIFLIILICITGTVHAKDSIEAGNEAFKRGDYSKAAEYYKLAIKNEHTNDEIEIWIARCMIKLEQWIQAESILLGQLSREPNNTVNLELLAYVYNQQKNQFGLSSIYRELIKIEPQNISHRITLAKILINQGQNKQAINVLEFARRLDLSYDVEINRLLGDLYLAENMSREASQYYEKIITKKDNPSAEDYFRLGLAYFKTRDFISSLNTFKLMEQIYPEDFRANLYLGRVFSEMERFDEAIVHYSSAIKKNPESLECLEALSCLQIINKLYSNAAENLAKAIELGDNRPQSYYNYIFALIKENNQTEAKNAIKNALAEYPSDEKIILLLNQFIKTIVPD